MVITKIFDNSTKGDKEPDRYVENRIGGNQANQMDGWTLNDEADNIITFPEFMIQPGQVYGIYTNK